MPRFFNPFTSRFFSPDPHTRGDSKVPQTFNLYAYARNSPVRYVDPDGKDEREGSFAGVVFNFTSPGHIIWVAGDKNKHTYVIPLDYGERSDAYIEDADAIVIAKGDPISGKASGRKIRKNVSEGSGQCLRKSVSRWRLSAFS